MQPLIVIPARYASTRYPGKPLVALKGASGQSRTLIQRSYEAACAVDGARVVVATDDDRIRAAAEGFGAEVVMTSESCRNGTERVAEAAARLGGDHEIVVNLQGDAPLTPHWFVADLVADLVAQKGFGMATPVLRCDGAALSSFREDRRAGRVGGTTAVFGADRRALYFSKEVIPYTGTDYPAEQQTPVWHHVGVYAYRRAALAAYAGWAPGPLEELEGLEQLRFLEQGHPILCTQVEAKGRAFWELNNPEDVPRIEAMLAQMGLD